MLDIFRHASDETMEAIAQEMAVRKTKEIFLLLAMGSQFDHLIKQQLERIGVFCLVADPVSVTASDVATLKPIGIILSGGPASVNTEPPPFDEKIFDLDIPVLGICLGFQMWAHHIGAQVNLARHREFGQHLAQLTHSGKYSPLFLGITESFQVLQSHGDRVEINSRLTTLATTDNAPVAAGSHQHLYGVQFHPEVTATKHGELIFRNFCFEVCQAKDMFPAIDVAKQKIISLRQQIGDQGVVLGISGGSDSAVVAYLLKQALVEKRCQVRGVYIRGIDRPDDEQYVRKYFGDQPWIDLVVVDATDLFLVDLAGKKTMKEKRLAMRGVYKKILEDQAAAYDAAFIAQGTLYTDISESGGGHSSGAKKAQIKLHHNTNLNFSLPELTPLADCVKDSARGIGRSIGVPEELLIRHPFPGPGLVVRIEGEVTAEKLEIARAVDGIYIEELRRAKLYDTVWQAGAVVTASVTTCTKGDDAAEGLVIALWAVWSVNGFTAEWAELPEEFRRQVSRRITNEIREVGAVVYRISDKPPATIEWG